MICNKVIVPMNTFGGVQVHCPALSDWGKSSSMDLKKGSLKQNTTCNFRQLYLSCIIKHVSNAR